MTNKSFVISVYPEAFCQGLEKPVEDRIAFVVYSDLGNLRVLGWSNATSTAAWKSAAKTLQEQMLETLEKK